MANANDFSMKKLLRSIKLPSNTLKRDEHIKLDNHKTKLCSESMSYSEIEDRSSSSQSSLTSASSQTRFLKTCPVPKSTKPNSHFHKNPDKALIQNMLRTHPLLVDLNNNSNNNGENKQTVNNDQFCKQQNYLPNKKSSPPVCEVSNKPTRLNEATDLKKKAANSSTMKSSGDYNNNNSNEMGNYFDQKCMGGFNGGEQDYWAINEKTKHHKKKMPTLKKPLIMENTQTENCDAEYIKKKFRRYIH